MAARVLLLEDDPAVCRYVAMALDSLPIELLMSDSVAQASRLLESGPVDLVLSDLTLVDGSALDFAKALLAQSRMPVAVFSAGITPSVEQQLQQAGVWRILHKPVGLKALQACVMEAVGPQRSSGAAPVPAPPAATPPVPVPVAAGPDAAALFEGSEPMLQSFTALCRQQFPLDAQAGDEALARRDMAALRRVAHNLKSVLRLIGEHPLADAAQSLDAQLSRDDLTEVASRWQGLRDALLRL
ncbi:response regulator [Paracidovorax wautersii]|uniref:Hpt domain-containing response regulator n=1 Tax=Paracidovorax wautersii TaxID=1177982 RepID=UPI0031D2233A